jgi:hypothetical protein
VKVFKRKLSDEQVKQIWIQIYNDFIPDLIGFPRTLSPKEFKSVCNLLTLYLYDDSIKIDFNSEVSILINNTLNINSTEEMLIIYKSKIALQS